MYNIDYIWELNLMYIYLQAYVERIRQLKIINIRH